MSIKDWKKLGISFVVLGLSGYVIETLFNGFGSIFNSMFQAGFSIWGSGKAEHTVWAFLVYCWAALPFFFLDERLEARFPDGGGVVNASIRAVIYGSIFTTIEFIVGAVLLYGLNTRGWNYSDQFLNIDGIISIKMYFMWIVAGFIGDWYYSLLRKAQDVWVEE